MNDVHVVFGAGGGAGGAVVRALVEQGKRVRAVTRSGRADVPSAVENVRADAANLESSVQVCEDARVIYHCVNVPYAQWETTLPAVMDTLIETAGTVGARLVYSDNLYMYGRVQGEMKETTPYAAESEKGRLRWRLADRLLEAHHTGRVEAVIGRASDFFGPGATNTVAGQLVFPAVAAGKRAFWIGSLNVPHTLNYIDDVAKALVLLGMDPRAPGEVWHIPGEPPVNGRHFIETVFDVAGRPPRIGVYPRWMMQLAGLFDRQKREILEVLYQFEKPFILNAEKFERTFENFRITPLRMAIASTLEWEHARATGR